MKDANPGRDRLQPASGWRYALKKISERVEPVQRKKTVEMVEFYYLCGKLRIWQIKR